MRILASVFLAVSLLGSSVSSVSAENNFKTIGDLLSACEQVFAKPPTSLVNAGFCVGYMQGANESVVAAKAISGGDPLYCAPDKGITNGQRARIFIKYAENHPETHHKHMSVGFIFAMQGAFPCPAK